MLLTVHATAALAISQYVANPALAFIFGLGSHFLLDFIPHGDKDLNRWLADEKQRTAKLIYLTLIDVLVFTNLLGLITQQKSFHHPWSALAAIFASLLPDFLVAVESLLDFKYQPFTKLNNYFHNLGKKYSDQVSLFWGITIQLTFFILALSLI
ncbi:MAG: hypothetical protein WCW02_01720 [Candidatus Buchananbacteria bacterium]